MVYLFSSLFHFTNEETEVQKVKDHVQIQEIGLEFEQTYWFGSGAEHLIMVPCV